MLAETIRSSPASGGKWFSPSEVDQFRRDGYFIARGLAEASLCEAMLKSTRAGLAGQIEPVEYEADVQYRGAPESRSAQGGNTIRRLKEAQARDPVYTSWISHPSLVGRLQQLLGPRVVMPLAHHNCVMTKQPRFSSETLWHQDIRYWSYQRPELVSVWLALGRETPENGCLQLIPGTHAMTFAPHRMDDALFLRRDLPENAALIETRISAELEAGDVLFFHCRTFHAADANRSNQPKFSAVFTFRPEDNPPVPGGKSAGKPELLLPHIE